jgi:hypothetical protein
MDTTETSSPQALSEITIPDPLIRQSLEAALYFKNTQEDPKRIKSIAQCVTTMSHMVNRIYSILEAIVSFRARFLHHINVVKIALVATHDHLDAQYELLTKSVGAGTIPNEVIGALTAFLVSGVKGLMVYPNDVNRYGIVKLTHFIALVDKLQGRKKIEEPVWKWTQKYLLDTIEASVFPQGLKKARESLDSSICDDSWEHADLSKFSLAKAMEVDFYNFCTNRSLFPGGDLYKEDLFELPDIPAAKVPKIKK